jgi:hypothetical protein
VSRRPKPAQQGGPDGLCGIYSLLNFIHSLPQFSASNLELQDEQDQEIFRYLLEAAHELDLLLPARLSYGFEQHHLRAIFNHTCDNLDLDYSAISLKAYAKGRSETEITSVIKSVVEDLGSAAVVHLNKCNHWVLAYDYKNGNVHLDDSFVWRDGKVGITKASVSQQREWGLETLDGLAIMSKSGNL